MEIKWLSELNEGDRNKFGIKAVKIALLAKKRIPIPFGFVLSFGFLFEFLNQAKVFELLNREIMKISSEEEATRLSQDIRTAIQMSAVDETFLSKIYDYYHTLEMASNNEKLKADTLLKISHSPVIVLRASYLNDFPVSFPPIRNIKGKDEIEEAIRQAFTFIFSPKFVFWMAQSHELPRIALIFQLMVNAIKSGFCRVEKNKPIEVFSTFGFIDSITKGEVYPDVFELNSQPFRILSRQIHHKNIAYYNEVSDGSSSPTLKKISLSQEEALDPSLTYNELKKLYELVEKLSLFIKSSFDFEWALDKEGFKVLNYEVKHMEEKDKEEDEEEKDVFEVVFEEGEEDVAIDETDNRDSFGEEGNKEDQVDVDEENKVNMENEGSSLREDFPEKKKEEEANGSDHPINLSSKPEFNIDQLSLIFDEVRDKYAKINPALKDILALYKEDVLEKLRKSSN